jgi:myosin heavy subunit
LLEKSRIIQPHEGERNYHIFYEMTQGMSTEEKAKYHLTKALDYRYLNCTTAVAIKGLDEVEELAAYKRALRLFEVSEEVEDNLFKILASVLHLGNTTYKNQGEGSQLENSKAGMWIDTHTKHTHTHTHRKRDFTTRLRERYQAL